MMGILNEKYQRFRQWQQQPLDYHDTHEHHVCHNCGAESDNNYCPRCGQKAIHGPMNWRSVWQGVMDVWGVGTRSLPYTLWQLVWRPGYLMRDYISGKRQVSFPPVKMLVVVGVAILLLGNWLEPGPVFEEDPVAPTGLRHYIDVAFNWLNRNMEWWVLLLFSFMIVPIWSLFREAPKYPHHTLPQGFYIQVFASTQFLLWIMLIVLIGELLLPEGSADYAGLIVFIFLVPLMLLIDFKQLFGYGWWGTFWRVVVVYKFAYLFMASIIILTVLYDRLVLSIGGDLSIPVLLVRLLCIIALIMLVILVIDMINRKSWRSAGWLKALRLPLITLGVLLVLLVVGEIIRPGALSAIFDMLFLE